jgi:ATP-dependent DNA ligase
MALPIPLDYEPMNARLVAEIPTDGGDWQYEPKWDGFRCLAFRDGKRIELQSKSGQPLGRYFPELVAALRELRPGKFVIDGEIVVPVDGSLSFDQLLQRIHPAESRIRKLSAETPATLIVFDILVDERGKRLNDEPLSKRRKVLEAFAKGHLKANPRLTLSPATTDVKMVRQWLSKVGGDLDGIIAKRADLPYLSGSRDGMQKYKLQRSADCVVGGFRYGKNSALVGSLLLGLYDEEGLLHHVGFSATLSARDKPALTRRLEALVEPPGFTGRAPGGPSRWSTERTGEWQPLRPELVIEVRYDQVTAGRFRHGTTLLRWRPDKAPRQCGFDQLPQAGEGALAMLDAASVRRRSRRISGQTMPGRNGASPRPK